MIENKQNSPCAGALAQPTIVGPRIQNPEPSLCPHPPSPSSTSPRSPPSCPSSCPPSSPPAQNALSHPGHGNGRSEKWSVSGGLGRVLPHSQSSIFSGKKKIVSGQKCKPLASLHKIARKVRNIFGKYLENALKVPPLNILPSVWVLVAGEGIMEIAREYIFTAILSIFSFSENIYISRNIYFRECIFQRKHFSENKFPLQFFPIFFFSPPSHNIVRYTKPQQKA